jgi:signal peptidase II
MPDAGARTSSARRFALWLLVALAVFALDQFTKSLVVHELRFREVRRVTEFFDWVLYYNTGAAFSLLNDAPGWQTGFFIGIGGVASVVILVLLRKHAFDSRFCLALSLILGGALGNVYDRAVLGHVVDFIQVHAGTYYWPAFNVADSAICCGAGLLIWDGLFGARKTAA